MTFTLPAMASARAAVRPTWAKVYGRATSPAIPPAREIFVRWELVPASGRFR
jgi:hypothetical protein